MRELTMKTIFVLTVLLLLGVAADPAARLYAQCPPCGGVPQTITTDHWTMQVVRPCLTQATTAGGRGGGIEIRNVRYRNAVASPFRNVIFKAHTPIINVKYQNDGCGPFRLWTYQESPYICTGTADTVNGRCNGVATTNCNNPPGGDVGTFCGVTVDTTTYPGILIFTTVVRASWFRFQLEWHFHQEGTIRPAIKWTASNHPCLQTKSLDMVYWRIDWDIEGSIPNQIEELNLWGVAPAPDYWLTWDPLFVEMNRMRDGFAGRWYRVRNTNTNRAYIMFPPEFWTEDPDGSATAPGIADIWALRYNTALQEETDDCAAPLGGVAFCSLGGSAGYWPHLSRFIDQTSDSTFLLARDVVTWYGASHIRPAVPAGTPTAGDCNRVTGPFLTPDPAGPAW